MNSDDAIRAHALWKTKLSAYLSHPDGSLKAVDVGLDDRCELGKWLHSQDAQHSKVPEIAALRATHADFHRATATAIRKIDAGQALDISKLTGPGSDFANLSLKIVSQIKAAATKFG